MEISFTGHALRQLRERNLTKAQVAAVVKNPLRVVTQSDGRFRAVGFLRRRNKKYVLVVVYEENIQHINVITEFITSKINKYL